jgi:ABC-type Fe3+-hydroxamate transport system substrate-binding protein
VTARVVSLVPSITETLLAWGVVPLAVTRFCEQPELPVVGGTKNPDLAAIAALDPDLVVLDREENRREDAEALEAAGVPIHVTAVRSVGDVDGALAGLRRAVGIGPGVGLDEETAEEDKGGEGDQVVAQGGQLAAVGAAVRVWVPIWRRPWMSINGATYGSSLLQRCGAVNVLHDHIDPYPTVTPEEIVGLAPDVVLAPTEPYPWAERHAHLFEGIAPMVIVDGHDLFWWGFRTPGAIDRMGRIIRSLAPSGAGR